ncbi:MAG TPA: acyl-ACP desaturase [Minicystis sp.]|nr:acyl-ACP desaturase [Minicystis sp.]
MAESFNIERFMEASGKLDLSDIDWSEVPRHPLTPEALRTLKYFLMTEGSTFFYTKALMKTKAAVREPEMAPFLCVWMYEEEYHGRAFRKFLDAYGERVAADYRTDMFLNRGAGERIDELSQTVLSRIFPDGWPAVHMVWGVIQEYTTYTAYQALIERINHPVLNVICQRIMKQELRHYAFYREHARRRLDTKTSQKLATVALKLGWTPVGDGMSKKEDVCHAIQFLFDGKDGEAIGKIEQKVRELPGLEWFDLFTRFAEQHAIGRAPSSWFNQRRVDDYQRALSA